jgi:predicted anti-sigma-YlaC factor YlaD
MMDCNELVELNTDYLEGTLAVPDHARLDEHLAICDGCTAYLDQMRTTLNMLGKIPSDSIGQTARERLQHAFRNWKETQ